MSADEPAGPNEIIHQSLRLRLMAALDEDRENGGEGLAFPRLKAILSATDGNLGAHLGTLEGAGYVQVVKTAEGKRTRTKVTITPEGHAAFGAHVAYLRAILDRG